MHGRCVGLEVTELLLLFGVQPPFTTSLFWRLVEAAVLVGHTSIHSQTGGQTEAFDVRPLLLLSAVGFALISPNAYSQIDLKYKQEQREKDQRKAELTRIARETCRHEKYQNISENLLIYSSTIYRFYYIDPNNFV